MQEDSGSSSLCTTILAICFPVFFPLWPFGLTMQHGDDGERGAAAAGSGLSAASSSSSSSALSAAGAGEALRASELRAIPLEFLGRWLASEVGVVDEGTRLQDGVFPVTVTK